MNVRNTANLTEELKKTRKGTQMDAWTDLNRHIVNDRMRERTNDAAAERLAAEARTSRVEVASEPRFRFEFGSLSDHAPSKA